MDQLEYIKKAKTELKRCAILLLALQNHWPQKDSDRTIKYLSDLDTFIREEPEGVSPKNSSDGKWEPKDDPRFSEEELTTQVEKILSNRKTTGACPVLSQDNVLTTLEIAFHQLRVEALAKEYSKKPRV